MVTGGTQCPAHSLESPFELACDTHRRACTHVQRSRAASRWCAPLYSPSPPLKCRLLARSWGPGTPHPAHPQLRPCRARPSVCGSRAKLFPPRDSRGKTFPIPTVGYCPLGASHRGLGGGQEGALRIPNIDSGSRVELCLPLSLPSSPIRFRPWPSWSQDGVPYSPFCPLAAGRPCRGPPLALSADGRPDTGSLTSSEALGPSA